MAFQGTRLRADNAKCCRNEYDKDGYMIFSWGRSATGNSSTGVMVVLCKKFFLQSDVLERFDGDKKNPGRVGAVRVRREDGDKSFDETFIGAYGCQNDADQDDKDTFCVSLRCTLLSFPGRTTPSPMVDANGHVGASSALAPYDEERWVATV